MKAWSLSLIEEQNENFMKMVDSKLKEVQMMQQKEGKPEVIGSITAAKGENLKEEVLQLFEDDKRLRNIRFQEVYNIIE